MNPPSNPSHDCPVVDDLAALRPAVTGLAREVGGVRPLGGFGPDQPFHSGFVPPEPGGPELVCARP